MYCRKCGNRLPDTSNFCNKCGTRVLRDIPPVPPVNGSAPVRTAAPVPKSAPSSMPAGSPKPSSPNTTRTLIIVGACIAGVILLIILAVGAIFVASKIFGSSNDGGDRYTYDEGAGNGNYVYPGILPFGGDNDSQGNDDYVSPDTQRTLCVSCHGTGTCPVCDGTGVYSNYGQSSVCSACGGTGVCSICGGSGYN